MTPAELQTLRDTLEKAKDAAVQQSEKAADAQTEAAEAAAEIQTERTESEDRVLAIRGKLADAGYAQPPTKP